MEIVKITREQAEEWLGKTIVQRNVTKRKMQFMTRDINNGDWNSKVAPAIWIDKKDGGILDGQNRIRAFLDSGRKIFVSYVGNANRADMEDMDQGTNRSLKNSLEMRGHEFAKEKSAWLNRGIQWAFGLKVSHVLTRKDQVEIIELVANMDKAMTATHIMHQHRKVLTIPSGVASCLWQMQQPVDGADSVVDYVTRLQSSQGLDDTMSRLQAKLLDAKNPRTKTTMSADTISYLIARGYSAYVNEEILGNIYARRQGVTDLSGFQEWVQNSFPTLV